MSTMPEAKPAAITSAFVPDIETVRTWLETKIKAGHFVALVTAIVALILRMRQINRNPSRAAA